MSETIVAVYDNATAAEKAVSDLLAANVPQSAIHRHTAQGSYAAANTSVSTRRDEDKSGFWSNLFGGSSSDHDLYDRAVEAGDNVVSVSTIPDHDHDNVMAILERHNPVDIDERAASYTGTNATAATTSNAYANTTGAATAYDQNLRATDDLGRGDTMQLKEEQLAVGKRLVNRGGTRVRRYVVETPVEQDVTLRDEHVTLERHPVTDGRPATDGDFTERTIELTETAEEAVVSKNARVVEEVSLNKVAGERTETVRDTVRREEVEVEQVPGTMSDRTVTGTTPRAPKI